jgi:ABC-2 type transport system ATP-binding protein
MADEYVIAVDSLNKYYGELRAVNGISFHVRRGETMALLGGNGAGKTTTLSMLLGVLLPTSGSVRILGEDMVAHRYRVLGRMNFTSPYVDLPRRLTVRENLTVYAHLYGLTRLKPVLARLADELNMAEFLERPYGQLSAGQKTRVSLAKSLLNEPDVLLLDEPTASLDPDVADRMRTVLTNYQRRTGATLLIASHNMQEVERMCDGVLMMREGKIVDRGTPDALVAKYGRANMEEVFLDVARGQAGSELAAEVS